MRKVTEGDEELLLKWANDTEVRKNSINENRIERENHRSWFLDKINSQSCHIFILESEGVPVGQIRFYLVESAYEIDLSLSRSYRNKGLGQILLKKGIEAVSKLLPGKENKPIKLKALVKSENARSSETFLKCGFTHKGVIETERGQILNIYELNKK
jgi:RimJ/RimL family protein N-acetyltransferase